MRALVCSFRTFVFLVWTNVIPIAATSAQDSGRGCGQPAVPVNAQVRLSSSSLAPGTNAKQSSSSLAPGTNASYTCDAGYELFGSANRTCLASGVWGGELPFCGTNVALHRPANQSTTVRGGSAGNANDGDKTTVHDGNKCTETTKEASPWWQVDLLGMYPVRVVRITTRGCCGHQPLQDIEIRVGNSSDLQNNPLCAWHPGTIEEGHTKTFICARAVIGQIVVIQQVGLEGSLSLCEVEIFTTGEFSNERCAVDGVGTDVDYVAFDRLCYEFNVVRGASYDEARQACRTRQRGDLVHGLAGSHNTFLLADLERRKPSLKTQLVWIGAHKEPGYTSRTWKWVNGNVISRPAWGRDQPNNYNGEQNCVVLDGGSNWQWNDVGCNLDYLHWICQHTPQKCGSPDKRENTTLSASNYSVGSVITYHCPTGHMLQGTKDRTCGEVGFWTGEAPSCKYIDCGPLSELEHGAVSLADNRTTHGSRAIFRCDKNYTLIGKEERICGDGGLWSSVQPQCLFDWCPEPPLSEGGNVVVSGKRTGSTATYSCQPGFILFGKKVLMCGIGGKWSGRAPTCKYVDCQAPHNIDHGSYELLNGTTTHGSIVEYSCEPDHWLEPPNHSRLTCLRDANWSDEPPTCEKIACPEPEVPKDGYIVAYDFFVHSTIEVHCNPGHVLRGQKTLECTSQGEWNGDLPACEFIDCNKVPPMLYGSASYTNGTTYLDSEILYSCVRNYRLVGVAKRQCQESKQWTGTSPRCEEIRCPEPTLPEHGSLSMTGNDRLKGRTLIRTADSAPSVATYKIGSLVKYHCERGYKVQGDPLSTCDDNGRWSGEKPQCIYVDCGMPTAPAHGQFTLASNATFYGAAVLYECTENYWLDGFGRRLCLDNGTWSAETPVCQEIVCREPETVGAMTVQVSTYSIGGVAHYSCQKGYDMQGNSTRICLKKGSWSGKIPICKPVDCLHPGPIDNGRVIVMNQSTTYSNAVEYHCVPQYQRIGPYLRKCMEDGLWSGEEPRCEMTTGPTSESQTFGLAIGVGAGIVLFLLIILGLIYLRLRKEHPVKNTENIEGAVRKEEQGAAVMSYASLNDGSGSHNNIYENIHADLYDAPYEETSHYEPSPISRRSNGATVTINGVAVR